VLINKDIKYNPAGSVAEWTIQPKIDLNVEIKLMFSIQKLSLSVHTSSWILAALKKGVNLHATTISIQK
jgi:hypothetical protein